MRAIRMDRPGFVAAVERPDPPAPRDGEALVRPIAVGVCGTDFSAFRGTMPLFRYPRVPGHELAVEVIQATGFDAGDRCAVEPYLDCGECFACRRGTINCCERLEVLGVHLDGGLQERFIVPARKLHPAPGLEGEQIAVVETLAIGGHAVDRAAPRPGDAALIVGAGPIGLAVFEFLRLAGIPASVADLSSDRAAFARSRGATEDDGSRTYPLVFDATGKAESMARSLHRAGHGATVVWVGLTPDDVPVPDPLLHRRELTVRASRNALPENFTRIIGLIREGKIDTRPWVTHRTTFDAFPTDFVEWARPGAGVVKGVATP